jgi:hypothetical protein
MPYQDTTRDKPSHTPGTPRGEALGKPVDRMEDDASGINPAGRKPIDPRMPHLPPA